MLSPDLAELYHVETRALVQAVKRNLRRLPGDFMFQLSAQQYANLKSQIVISSWGGARRAAPYAFTEHGVAMSAIIETINQLLLPEPLPPKRRIGFNTEEEPDKKRGN